jgi:hypothetical protein
MNAMVLFDRKLWPAAAAALLLAATGAILVAVSHRELGAAERELATARAEHAGLSGQRERSLRSEREAAARAGLYGQLVELHVIGAERRLEWAETLERIQRRRALPDMRYEIAPRRLLRTLSSGAGGVASHASTLKLELGLVHAGDLLDVLDALRRSGNAYYAVRQCAIGRNAPPNPGTPRAARLRARCDIDLVTIEDGAARP